MKKRIHPMPDYCPRIFTVDFGDILNRCLLMFFNDYNSQFTRYQPAIPFPPVYIFSGSMSKCRRKLKEVFGLYVDDVLGQFHEDIWSDNRFDNVANKKIVVLDSPLPSENVLSSDFPKDKTIRFRLTEEDIKLNLDILEPIWNSIFIDKFKNNKDSDFVFIRNKRLNATQLNQLLYSYYKGNMYAHEFNAGRRILEDSNSTTVFVRPQDMDDLSKQRMRYVIREAREFIEKTLLVQAQ